MNDALSAGADLSDDDTVKNAAWGIDGVSLSSDVVLSNVPIGLAQGNLSDSTANSQVALGLGRNSAILSKLKEAKRIGSRTWSMWWGLDGADESSQMDGSIVFGGYDAAKVRGSDNYTARIAESSLCPAGLTVTISEILLNFPNGSTPNLLDPSSGNTLLRACICPHCPMVMSLPSSLYYERFEDWTETESVGRSEGIDFSTMVYPADEVYRGNLTIKLDSGLTVQIPSDQLVKPDTFIAPSGQVEVNEIVRNVMIDSLPDSRNEMPSLGRYFLSAAYLMVNYDTDTFTLWKANPTTERDPVAVAGPGAACTSDPTNDPDALEVRPEPSRSDDSWSPGEIAGTVLGILAGCALVGLLLWWLVRRSEPMGNGRCARSRSSLDEVRSSEDLWG